MKARKIWAGLLVVGMLGWVTGCSGEKLISAKEESSVEQSAVEQSRDTTEVSSEQQREDVNCASEEGWYIKSEFQKPAEWNYQFAAPMIGSFYGYNDEDAGAIDMEDGKTYGFDDRLTLGCSAWCGCTDYKCQVQASSTLAAQGSVTYDAEHLSDGNRDTVWAEGAAGTGIGESISITQMYAGSGDPEFTFTTICIVNGYAQNETKWQENGRVKSLKLYYEDEYIGVIVLEDTMKPQYIDVSPVRMKVGNGCEVNFRFEIAEVYEGTKYEDTCLTGIVIDFEGKYAHSV